MKKKKKIILISLAALVLIIGGILAYFYFRKSPVHPLWNYVPRDAVYVIETDKLTEGWSTLSGSETWRHLITDPLFGSMQKRASVVDSMLHSNEDLSELFTDRPLLISCHMLPDEDFEFLFLIDMKEGGKYSFIKDYADKIVERYGYTVSREDYKETNILTLSSIKDKKDVFYISVIDNVFILSYSKKLVQNSITAAETPGIWQNDKAFREVADATNDENLFRFYANYTFMAPYFGYYITDEQGLLGDLESLFRYSAFNVTMDGNRLKFDGNTILNDSASSFMLMMSEIEKGHGEAYKVIPADAAMYMSITFADYSELHAKLEKEHGGSGMDEKLKKNLSKISQYFGIDLEKMFFSWIGNEIALVKLPPTPNAREDDMIAVVHTKDTKVARAALELLTGRLNIKTPLDLGKAEYKDVKIYYFGVSGFFKMFFGKIFSKLDQPYFIFLDDYVIFSNSPSCLMDMIDAWDDKRVLANDEAFMSFRSQFDEDANVSVYLQGPYIYSHLYHYAQPDRRDGIKKSRDILASFRRIGFQLSATKKGLFKNRIIMEHETDALFRSELEKIENNAEDLYIDEFDSLLVTELPKEYEDGKTCYIHYENDTSKEIRAEGRIIDQKREGMWRYYYENGNEWGTIIFNNDKPEKGLLYYDDKNGSNKAQVDFKNGKMHGSYLEFYKNGKPKARIEFVDSLKSGPASFYYDSGNIMIEGEYKEGMKTGKWQHYTETGDQLDKKKWQISLDSLQMNKNK